MLSIIINLHWDFTALSVPLVPRGKRKAWIFRRLEVQFPMGMPVLKVCVSIFFACSHLDTSLKWQIQRISVVNYKQSCRKMTTQCLIAACHGWTVPTPMWFNPCVYYNVASLDYCTVRWVNAAHTVQKKDNKILWTISPVSVLILHWKRSLFPKSCCLLVWLNQLLEIQTNPPQPATKPRQAKHQQYYF